jgi:hypothetical protein
MYVSQLLSKENWSKSPDSDERAYKAGIFLQILGFFSFSSSAFYSDLSFWQNYYLYMLNKPHITDTESKVWTKCPRLRWTRLQSRKFFVKSLFFFHLLPENYAEYVMLNKLHITDTASQRFGLIAQSPTLVSTKQEIFAILDFFFIFFLRITLTTIF